MHVVLSGQLDRVAYPPIIGVSELSVLLRKSPASLLADRCRAPHLLPPDCTPPGSKQPLWLLQDVLEWLAQFRRPAVPSPAALTHPRRGAPTKDESIRAKEAGLSVRDLRAKGGAIC